MDKLRFMSLGSGSSGNCYYIGNMSQGLLIDAGVGIRTLKKRLREVGIGFEQLWGVFITHDHIDHVRAAVALAEKNHIPVYATTEVHRAISYNRILGGMISVPYFIKKHDPLQVGDFTITAFPVSHDGVDNVGYEVCYKGSRFTLATDLGRIGENEASFLNRANFLVLEANYDESMLEQGHYPRYLKDRIKSATGHLSNAEAGDFLASCYTPQLSHIYLCHLSQENNLPELAYAAVEQKLLQRGVKVGVDVQLHVLPRTSSSPVYTLDSKGVINK